MEPEEQPAAAAPAAAGLTEEEEQVAASFGLPPAVLAALPSDPYQQLDLARRITSIALSTRIGHLEAEVDGLRGLLAERDDLVAELRTQLVTLDASLSQLNAQLRRADEEKEALVDENMSLAATVKKLNRDVSKLEVFRKTLMQSLQQEEDENAQVGHARTTITGPISFSSGTFDGELDDARLPASQTSSARIEMSDTGSSIAEDGGIGEPSVSIAARPYVGALASHGSTPRLTPPDSPPRTSASGSPRKSSKPGSPRRHSISFSTARTTFDDRASVFASQPQSRHLSMTSPFNAVNQSARTKVDGKEFFRQVRSRLSPEQFTAFLANVKGLNSHNQTREETLRKADEIFGSDNKDLYAIFEGLITRNIH